MNSAVVGSALQASSLHTDVALTKAAYDVLDRNAAVPKYSVCLEVHGGFVTLFGEVHWPHERTAAIDTVKNLIGVRGIYDEIKFEKYVSAHEVDAQISRTA